MAVTMKLKGTDAVFHRPGCRSHRRANRRRPGGEAFSVLWWSRVLLADPQHPDVIEDSPGAT